MCQTLSELERAMAGYAAGFDAALVAPADLVEVVRAAGAIEKRAAAISCLAAARMASGAGRPVAPGQPSASGTAARVSFRQAAQVLAHATGTSIAEARRAIGTGKAMRSQPELAAAAMAGELSRHQAALVAIATSANPGAMDKMLDKARTASLSELADEAGRATAGAGDLEAQRRQVYAERSVRHWTDPYGRAHLALAGLPEHSAQIMAAIRPFADQAFEAARKAGRFERPEAYAYDGLVALASAGGAQVAPSQILVRVDHTALVRGYAMDGETCEIAGFGTVTPQVVYDMMNSGDPFLKCIVTKGKDVIGVAHLGRRPNAHQRSALDWLFPTCAAEGCGVRDEFLQTDHRQDWAKTHVTVADRCDRLCHYDHWLKTYYGWALVPGSGKRPFVPPDDPRHPNYAGPGSTNGPPP